MQLKPLVLRLLDDTSDEDDEEEIMQLKPILRRNQEEMSVEDEEEEITPSESGLYREEPEKRKAMLAETIQAKLTSEKTIQKKDNNNLDNVESNPLTWVEELGIGIAIFFIGCLYYVYENSPAKDVELALNEAIERNERIKNIDPEKTIAFLNFLTNLGKEILDIIIKGDISILSKEQKEQFFRLVNPIVAEVKEFGGDIFIFPEQGERGITHTGEIKTNEPEVLGGFGEGERIETDLNTGDNSKKDQSLLDRGILSEPTTEERHARDYMNEARRGKTPKSNKAQNKQYKQAVKEIEKIIGRKLDKEDLTRLHEAITGEGYGFWEIVITGVEMFGSPEDVEKIPEDKIPEDWR